MGTSQVLVRASMANRKSHQLLQHNFILNCRLLLVPCWNRLVQVLLDRILSSTGNILLLKRVTTLILQQVTLCEGEDSSVCGAKVEQQLTQLTVCFSLALLCYKRNVMSISTKVNKPLKTNDSISQQCGRYKRWEMFIQDEPRKLQL